MKSFSRSPEFGTRKALSGSGTNYVKVQAEKPVKGQPCDTVVLMVVNFSEEPLTVQKGRGPCQATIAVRRTGVRRN